VQIESIRHKALRKFAENGTTKGLPGNLVSRLDDMLAYLKDVSNPAELSAPPNFGAHGLTGDLAGRWSLIVTRNWRMTFGVNEANEIVDLDLEDYH
jgi:proteic killer suppression protein